MNLQKSFFFHIRESEFSMYLTDLESVQMSQEIDPINVEIKHKIRKKTNTFRLYKIVSQTNNDIMRLIPMQRN